MNYRKIAASVAALAVLATSTLTFGATVTVAATTFNDASSVSGWAADAVAKLADAGVISGRANGSFDPAGNLNRAEVAKVAVLGAKLTTDTTGAPHFNDVKPTDWFYPFVETLYNKGVVGGINGGKLDNNGLATYNPAGTLNRAEASKILVDAFGLKKAYAGTPPNFTDVTKEAWYFDYVETAYAHGLIKGYGAGKFGPADAITREQVAVITQGTREEAGLVAGVTAGSKQLAGYKEGLASTVATTTTTTDTTTTTTPASDGTLAVLLSANNPVGATLPRQAAGVPLASFDLTASSAGDVTVTTLSVHRGGLAEDTAVTNIALYANGVRVSKSKTFTSSDDTATVNLLGGGLKVAAGTTTTVVVVGTIGASADSPNPTSGEFFVELASNAAVTSNAKSVNGVFPVSGKTMKVGSVDANELQVQNDGVASTVKLAQLGTEILKFKLKNTAADSSIKLNSITFKEEGTVDETTELANFKLFIDGAEVASTAKITDKYLSFSLATPLEIKSSKTMSAVVKADITGGATKYINFQVDSALDVGAIDAKYNLGAKVTFSTFNTANDGSTTGKRVAIDAGELAIVAVDAPVDTIRADKDDVVLGTLKISSKAGKALELQKVSVNIVNTGTNTIDELFETGSVEIYDGTSVYDLTNTTVTTTKNVTFYDSDLSIAIPATGDLNLQIRANTQTTIAALADAVITISVPSIGGSTKSSSGFYVEETADDKPVTDVTPSSITFKTISGTTSNATLSMITQSAAKSAVIGSTGIEAAIFEIKAGNSSDLTLDTVKVVGTVVDAATAGTAAFDNTRVTKATLYQNGVVTALDSVSGSQLSSNEATFDGFKVKITKNQSVRFIVKLDLVNDQNQASDTINLKVNELQLADDDNDDLTTITYSGATPAYNALNASSARTVTIRGVGTITATVDNTDAATNKAKYVLGNTTSDFVASYELTATNEGVKIKDFTFANTGTANMQNSLSEVVLYKGDQTTEIARKSVTGDTVTFTDVNYVVAEGSENVYVKVIAHKMGKDQAGQIKSGIKLTFDIDKAEGNESGKAIADGDVAVTSASNVFTTIPTRISAISFESTYGGVTVANKLTNGSNNVAIIKITTDASANTDADTGASLKTLLSALKFTVDSDADGSTDATNLLTNTANAASITVERINGTGDNVAALTSMTAGAAVVNTASIDAVNLEIDNGSSAYFVVKAGVADLTDSTQKYVQVKLSSLDVGDATANIQYTSNDTTAVTGLEAAATARQALLLNMTTLDSAKVSQ